MAGKNAGEIFFLCSDEVFNKIYNGKALDAFCGAFDVYFAENFECAELQDEIPSNHPLTRFYK